MRPKLMRTLFLAVLAAAALTLAACSHTPARTDAQISGEIQGKFYADQSVQNKGIAVQAASGVVTLSGQVASDAERSAAAADAASVGGVRTVVNNLTVTPPVTSSLTSPEEAAPQTASVEQPAPAAPSASTPPEPAAPEPRVRHRHERNHERSPERNPESSDVTWHHPRQREANQPAAWDQAQNQAPNQMQPEANQGYAQANAQYPPAQTGEEQTAAAAQPSYAPPPAAPAPPQPPAVVTVPGGTSISIRLLDTLDSSSANPGDSFRATLSAPVQVDGNVVVPEDADLMGQVVDVQSAGRIKGGALLTLELTRLSFNGRAYSIQTNQWSQRIQGRGKNTAEKVGGGAALGAVIGALAGGGKGAAIGTLVGGGAGGTAQAVTHGKQVTLGPESLLRFRLAQPVTVHPASYNQRNARRPRLE